MIETNAAELWSPDRNRRGFFVIGPQCVNPSDILARLMEEAKLALAATHYAPSPEGERKQHVTYAGRRRRYAKHGRAELVAEVYG